MSGLEPLAVPLMIATTALSVVSQMQAGRAAEAQAEQQANIYRQQAETTQKIAEYNAQMAEDEASYEAARLREQSIEEEAAGIREAKEKRRQTRLAASTARAKAGTATDPTVMDIIGDIFEQGEYGAKTSLYEGKSAASLLRSQANLTEYQGQQEAEMARYEGAQKASLYGHQAGTALYEGATAKQQGYTSAVGTVLEGASNIASKYAPDDIQWSDGTTTKTGKWYYKG